MPIQIKAPDGSVAQFPDGTDDATITKVMAAHYPATGAAKPGIVATINGAVDNVLRGTGVGDELAGGWRALAQTLMGHPTGFSDAMAQQRGDEDAFAQAHPIIAGNLNGAGMGASLFVPGGATVQGAANLSRGANMVRGAGTAAATAAGYALADRGTPQERMQAALGAAVNPINLALGAAGGALLPAAAKGARTSANPDIAALNGIGVQTTIPQQSGPTAKVLEDTAMRFPILGQAVSGARNRQLEQLNRGVALKALEPIGEKLPTNLKPGFETVDHVDKALGAVYDKAAALVPKAQIDAPFMADLDAIQQRLSDLPETEAKQFQGILSNRLTRLADDSSGQMVKNIASELGKLRSEAVKKGQDTLAGMLGDTRGALMGIIGRSSPEAADLISKADRGWQVYSILNDASAAASNRGGVFLPGQLGVQVRAAGKRMGSNMTGKGKAPLQDISTAASRILPDSFGNPGTANATLLSGGAVGALAAPVQTALGAAGLGAAGLPYALAARGRIDQLPGATIPLPSAGRLPPEVVQRLLTMSGVTTGAGASQSARSASR